MNEVPVNTRWYEVENIEKLDSPALIFYPERIRQNIEIAKSIVGDVHRLRPHVKTHKSIEITSLMLEAGITKFKCATIAEAEILGMCNVPDVLLAYQPVLGKVRRLVSLMDKYNATQFSCLVDNANTAAMIAVEAQKAKVDIAVFIDVNIGMNRTGVLPKDVIALYEFCTMQKGIVVRGLHAYDGHIYSSDLAQRKAECEEGFKPVQELVNAIEKRGYEKPIVVAGGTPTFPVFAQMKNIECSPGTFTLWDEGYRVLYPDMPFLNAAVIITRVISKLDSSTFCLDLGHKAIAAENSLDKRIRFLNAPEVKFLSHSEEHLVIRSSNKQLGIGDVLYGVPIHICPTCALYDFASIVVNGQVVDEWEIQARTRRITI
jgi:D-serine deaminase-like pyridoxal phosphate-dependent protein